MDYQDSSFDEMLEPYFCQLEQEFLPKYQEKLGDYSDMLIQRYAVFIRRHYRVTMMSDLCDMGSEVTLPTDSALIEQQLRENFKFCRRNEIDNLENASTNWLVERLELPIDSEKDNQAIARLWSFMDDTKKLVLATVLGKVTPNPDGLGHQVTKFNELVKNLSHCRKGQHSFMPRSPFAISDTLVNLSCAYGKEPIWEAPIFRNWDNLYEAGPLDDGCLYGFRNMNSVRRILGEEPLPLPEEINWEKAIEDDNDQLLNGDWNTPMPADMRRALDYCERARREATRGMTESE